MVKIRNIVHGVGMNWAAMLISIGTAFFLSPFVVHSLGNVAYGVWTIANSVISYMGLLDLGLRGAVMRFVSAHYHKGEHEESARAVSAALWLRMWLCLGILLLCVGLSAALPSLFRIPPEMQKDAQFAVVLLGASLGITLTLGVFGGVLAALNRFDLLGAVGIAQTILRAAGTIWLLKSGFGFMVLAIWFFLVAVATNVAVLFLCLRIYPELKVYFRRPDRHILRSIWGYSIYVFVLHICVQIIHYTDNLVVGAFVSVEAVTFFAIAGGLIEYLRQLVSSMTSTFTPLASTYEAQDNKEDLRNLLTQGTRASLFLGIPILVVLFIQGPSFIRLWMGEQYAEVSGHVLQILLISQFFSIANYTALGITLGTGKHRPIAIWATVEAFLNIFLSILLVRRMGIAGVAWGTVIPNLFVHIFIFPKYVCRILDVPLFSHLFQTWVRPGMTAIPFAIGCYLVERYWPSQGMLRFFLQVAMCLPLFLASIVISFRKEFLEIFSWKPKYVATNSNVAD